MIPLFSIIMYIAAFYWVVPKYEEQLSKEIEDKIDPQLFKHMLGRHRGVVIILAFICWTLPIIMVYLINAK